jgi:hypothetical protein
MSKKLNDYLDKVRALNELQKEVEKLKSDKAIVKTFEFEQKLKELMKQYAKKPADVVALLSGGDATEGESVKKSAGRPRKETAAKSGSGRRAKRATKVYRNPETGEVVKTKGGNHKVLNLWREQYGKDAVNSWLES